MNPSRNTPVPLTIARERATSIGIIGHTQGVGLKLLDVHRNDPIVMTTALAVFLRGLVGNRPQFPGHWPAFQSVGRGCWMGLQYRRRCHRHRGVPQRRTLRRTNAEAPRMGQANPLCAHVVLFRHMRLSLLHASNRDMVLPRCSGGVHLHSFVLRAELHSCLTYLETRGMTPKLTYGPILLVARALIQAILSDLSKGIGRVLGHQTRHSPPPILPQTK